MSTLLQFLKMQNKLEHSMQICTLWINVVLLLSKQSMILKSCIQIQYIWY